MSGIDDIRGAVDDAVPFKAKDEGAGDKGRDAPKTRGKGDGGQSDLKDGCPVVPLGLHGNVFYYMDACKQLQAIKAEKHQRLVLQSLFVPHTGFVEVNWPRYNKDGDVVGPNWDEVARDLMDSAGRIGPIDIDKRVRGAGCWVGDDGQLVMHCGDKIFAGHDDGGVRTYMPGKFGDHVYPAAPALPHPDETESGMDAGREVLALLQTWNWARPDVDPHLLLGWIAAAMMGAALDWRPAVWITGDKATGKSTLHKLISGVIHDRAMVSSVDASAAGIRQAVGRMSLPVALDELEADDDNRKAMDIVKLARFACSGGQSLRGGADHKGASFTLRNCFLFSSILIPPMLSQDISRMAILNLDKLNDVMPPALEPARLKQIGQVIRRRLLLRWNEFQGILERYRYQLAEYGHTGRSADQFGTLMACHDLVLYDYPIDGESLAEVSERLRYSGLSEAEDDVADWERCVAHLMTATLDFYRNGEKRSVGSWVMQAAGLHSHECDEMEGNRALANYGMRVADVTLSPGVSMKVLMVANAHQGLSSIFKDTHWTGKSGTSGVWVQSLRRVPHAGAGKTPTTFDGVMTRYTQVPLDSIIHKDMKGGA